jgi:hypothetical protein
MIFGPALAAYLVHIALICKKKNLNFFPKTPKPLRGQIGEGLRDTPR